MTGIKPARYQELGFFGGKMPLPHGPADGIEGLNANVEMVAQAREAVGPDFDLMLDCYMALDVPYTIELANAVRPYRVRWIEEALPPDDYDGHARIKAACPWQRFTTGEHEYTRYGFRELIAAARDRHSAAGSDWVGGITEARKIAAMAAALRHPGRPARQRRFQLHFQMAYTNTPVPGGAGDERGRDGDHSALGRSLYRGSFAGEWVDPAAGPAGLGHRSRPFASAPRIEASGLSV